MMTLEYWDKRFEPEHNFIAEEESSFGGAMFETYGPELDYVLDIVGNEGDARIWTLIDGDEHYSIVSGYHVVNRVGYFVTRTPANDDPAFQEVEVTE